MNTILLTEADFIGPDRVRLTGRRLKHVRQVHRASLGQVLRVGLLGGLLGEGQVEGLNEQALELRVALHRSPASPMPVRLVLALPRPKVIHRIIADATAMGIKQVDIINAWRVDKSYWGSPLLDADNLRTQAILGLEQAGDTILPVIQLHRLFTSFVHGVLPARIAGRVALVADPSGDPTMPRAGVRDMVLAIGPEGGFIERELASFLEIGFTKVSLGPRILRVETAVAYLLGRLQPG